MKLEGKFADDVGNSISVGEELHFGKSEVIFKEGGSSIIIGSRSRITEARFEMGKNASITIGDDCRFSGTIVVGSYSSVVIGNSLSVTRNLYIRAVEKTTVRIGDDCLVASDVVIRTTDGHVINSRIDRTRLNPSLDVVVKDHVWIGDRAVILKGVVVEESSVIGIGSIVTRNVPPNVIVAGAPATVKKKNIVWEHGPGLFSDKYYDE